MIVKKIVTSALIISLSSLGIILFAGVFLPTSVLNRMIGSDGTNAGIPMITTTSDTVKIADANAKKDDDSADPDGSHDDTTADETKPTTSTSPSTDTKSNTSSTPSSSGSTTPKQTTTPTPSPTPAPTPAPKPAPTPTPTPTPAPAPACGSGGNCSAAQVASHNTQANCWVIYNNKVYNVTGFVSRHPGGRSVFNGNTCGRDIGQYLAGTREPTSGDQFRHTSGDISDINPYYVANLG